MSTDENGVNAYFHCLIFHEQFSLEDIQTDFDTIAAQHRAARQKQEM